MASGGDSGAGGYLCAKSGGEVEVVKKGEGEGFVREELWTVHRQIFRFFFLFFLFPFYLFFVFSL